MKRIFRLITMAGLISLLIPSVSSCDDDENPISEWDMSYVTLLPADYLRPTPSFTLKHVEEEGVEGSVEYQFLAVVQKASNQDIKVNLAVTCDGISEDNIDLTSRTAIIKAGSLKSDLITVSINKWDDLISIKEAADYTLNIKINGIEAAAEVTSSGFNQEISLKISKSAERKKQKVLLTDPTKWLFTFMEGVENPNSNTVAGTGGNDVATSGVPFWLTVDFLEIKTLTGIQTRHWASGYAPKKIELFTSADGNSWTSIGVYETSGSTQTVNFEEHIKTRYLKYQMITVPSRVDITRFYVYSWE